MSRFFLMMTRLEMAAFRARGLILWVGLLVICLSLHAGIARLGGGGTYAISEMLINYAGGFVRRGLAGEVTLALHRTFGGAPEFWAWAVLSAMACLAFALCQRIYARLPDDPALLVFVLAPWGLLFLAYDALLGVRKEIIGYIALAMILIAVWARDGRRAIVWVAGSVGIFGFAILAHEVNFAFGPMLLLATVLVAQVHPGARVWLAGLAGLGALVGVVVFITVALHGRGDAELMCDAVGETRCIHAFEHLNVTLAGGIAFAAEHASWTKTFGYLGQLLLCCLPFWGVVLSDHSKNTRRVILVLLGLHIAAILPLFVVAMDWGRWIQMIILPASLVFCTALALGQVTYRRVMPPVFGLIYIGSWSMTHYLGALEWKGLHVWIVLAVILCCGALWRWAAVRS